MSSEENPVETTSSNENLTTGNSLSGVFAAVLLALTVAGISIK